MAFEAFYANISPQPHHLPLVAAAGMSLLEPDHVTELNLHDHIFHFPLTSHRLNIARLRYKQLGTAKIKPTASTSRMECSSLM